LTALHIEAEVVRWIYNVGSEKPSATSRTDFLETASDQTNGFFSPQSNGFKASSMPQETPTSATLLEAHSSNIALTIFTANVDVRLDKKMTEELLRSTKKNPPSRLRYELIYVGFAVITRMFELVLKFAQTGKDEYDSSVKAEEEAEHSTGSVFQGLRADLEGFVTSLRVNVIIDLTNRTGSTRVFIVSVNCFNFLWGNLFL